MADIKAVENAAWDAITEHLPGGVWGFQWDHRKSSYGQCNHRMRVITLSLPLTEACTFEECMDTILHEVAHAIAGPGANHGPVWRSIAIRLGAAPRAARAPEASTAEALAKTARWVGTCPNGHTATRDRLTQKSRRISCGRCNPRWDSQFLFEWYRNDARSMA